MGEKATNNLTNEREWLIWIQKLTDKDGGLNDLGVLVNLPGLYNILWVAFGGKKCNFLANIFNLRKMQISSVYHNYLGLLNIGDLLQKSVFRRSGNRVKVNQRYQ